MSFTRPRRVRRPAPLLCGGVTTVGFLIIVAPSASGAQELRYSLTPTAQRTQWDDALGLEDTFLYGGRLGFVFGRLVELQGFYLTNRGADTRVADLYERLNVDQRPPQNPGLDVSHYGANVVVNFGSGGLVPFLRGGGGVLRFAPDGGQRSDRIALSYGGGLRFGRPGGLRLNVFAEDVRFRVDRTLLLALPTTGGTPPALVDEDADELRSNLAYGAGLSIPLGGAVSGSDSPVGSLGNVSVPAEVFGGVLEFNGATGLGRQNVAGVRAGLDFGPLVGLRGTYWRGVNSDYDSFEGVEAIGAEAQFNLNAGSGIAPFVLLGGTQLRFRDDLRGIDTAAARRLGDQTALVLGGGVRIPLTDRFRLTGAARNYLMSRAGRLEDVNDPGQLRSNWQYTAGLSFAIGGRTRPPTPKPRTDTVFVDRATGRPVDRDAAARRDDDRVVRELVADTVVVTTRGDTLRGAAADSALRAGAERQVVTRERTRPAQRLAPGRGEAGYASDRVVEVVVPTEGEITVRYGPPREQPATPGAAVAPSVTPSVAPSAAAPTASELRDAVREAVRTELDRYAAETPRSAPATPSSPRRTRPATGAEARTEVRKDAPSAEEIERRVMERMQAQTQTPSQDRAAQDRDEMRRAIREELDRLDRDRADAERRARDAEGRAEARIRELEAQARERQAAPQPAADRSLNGFTAYSGATFTGGGQALVGGRIDLGELTPTLPGFRLVPELAFGFGGGGTSTLIAANAAYEVGGFRTGLGRLRPHVSLGAGFLNLSERVGDRDGLDLVVNPAYGASLELPGLARFNAGVRRPALLVEHQGIGFFDVNRLIVGLRWR
jgi:hypothetical protein